MNFKELFKLPSTKRKEEEERKARELVESAKKLAEENSKENQTNQES